MARDTSHMHTRPECRQMLTTRQKIAPARPRLRSRSHSAVVILNPHDIVLAEIAAGLDLDQLQVDLAGILEAMLRSDRDVDRFVLVNDLRLLPDHDAGRAADNNPVLGTMVMQLQREPSRRLHDDALDLEAVTLIEA